MKGNSSVRGFLVIVMVISCLGSVLRASRATSIWFGPDNDTADLLDLFKQPQLWVEARSKLSVLKLGPQQVSDGGPPHPNNLSDMRSANAFQLLRSWGIKLAIEAPAIKKWDCTGANALDYTLKLVRNVEQSGGRVDFISMDGPLIDAMRDCGDTLETAAAKTATYIRGLKSQLPDVEIGESEPYPANSVDKIHRWYGALVGNGVQPTFFHMDANVHFLDIHREIDVASDLRGYSHFLRSHGIRFGVVFWSGYDPAPTDKAYYDRVMAWVKQVHAAMGAPDDWVFQSWVRRSAPRCGDTETDCNAAHLHCTATDPAGCGEKSVPINLPEDNPGVYSHTRLINEASKVLSGP
jgi:hypothetical protein